MSDFLECHEYLLFVMDLGVRARLRYQTALIQARLNLNVANINLIAVERRRRRRQRRWWTRPDDGLVLKDDAVLVYMTNS